MGTRLDRKAYMKQYRKQHRKQLSEERKLWAKLHPRQIKKYAHEDYLKHKNHIQEQSKTWKQRYGKKLRREWRLKLIATLGGKCSRCGFDDARALQVDHVRAGGTHDPIKEIHEYKRVIESFLRNEGEYQLLCANCNWIKRCENGEQKKLIEVT